MQELIEIIINRALEKEGITHSNLLDAIKSGNKDAFKTALDACSDVNMGYGAPLIIAAASNEYNFCQALFMRGAGINLVEYTLNNMKSEYPHYDYLRSKDIDTPYKVAMRNHVDVALGRLRAFSTDYAQRQEQNRTEAIRSIADQIGLFRETMLELFGDKNQKRLSPASNTLPLPGSK